MEIFTGIFSPPKYPEIAKQQQQQQQQKEEKNTCTHTILANLAKS